MAQDAYVAKTPIASGTTFAQLQAGGVVAQLNRMIAANPALANPTTQATVAATGGSSTGGNLPAGVYYCSYTFVDGFGETQVGTSESASFTIAAGNIPQVTLPSLPTGAAAIRLYLTAVGGAAGSETLYATGITGTTFNMSYAAGSDPLSPPPTKNTTGAALAQELLDHLLASQNFFVAKALGVVNSFVQGDPVALNELKLRLAKLAAVAKLFSAALDEVGVLVAANPGRLTTSVNPAPGVIGVRTYRTWP